MRFAIFVSLLILVLPLAGQYRMNNDPRKMELLINMKGSWKFNIGDNLDWASEDFNDSRWTTIRVPSPWENQGFHGYDGYAWYRSSFMLHRDNANDDLFIDLGYIDDVDEVYINGNLIGFNGSFPPDFYTAFRSYRLYNIPADVLYYDKPNTIAVRVFDTVLDGGIMEGNIGIVRRKKSDVTFVNLEGIWKIHEDRNSEWLDPEYDDRKWNNIIVPGNWQSLKNNNFISYATYRKKFVLPPYMASSSEELVVMLGKIDDFDKVYLNGHLIGYTKDGLDFGQSQSWQSIRVYVLPEIYLDRYGENVLTVEVEDLGGNAGIYVGPIGISTVSKFEKILRSIY